MSNRTTHATPTTEDQQDPRTHREYSQRHNPNAWRDHSVPPNAWSDRHFLCSHSWQMHDTPFDAICGYSGRSRNLLTFARSVLNQWADAVYHNDDCPPFDLHYNDVQGLIELLNVAGENIDLAMNAAWAANELTKQASIDHERACKR